MDIFIAGDVVPKGTQKEFNTKGEQILGEIKPYVVGADFSIVNLEAPVINVKPTPIKKSGPCLGVAPLTVKVLKDAGFGVFTLANNHFYDQGQTGVNATIDTCNQYGILTAGGGKTDIQARKPLMLEKEGKQVAIINACEHEFSIATSEHGGSNPIDLIHMQKDITTARKIADYVVVILHGGVEQYHYPTPRMKRWYRHFVDLGADAVINHHQHCINGYEVYKGKPIFYGLGNFYFPKKENENKPNSWNFGYAVRLTLNEQVDFELIPYKQNAEAITLRDKVEFAKEIEGYNQPIADDLLLQKKYDEFIIARENTIKMELLPSFLRNRLFSALVRRGYFGKLYKGKHVFSLKNKLTCESHCESMQRLFEILTK